MIIAKRTLQQCFKATNPLLTRFIPFKTIVQTQPAALPIISHKETSPAVLQPIDQALLIHQWWSQSRNPLSFCSLLNQLSISSRQAIAIASLRSLYRRVSRWKCRARAFDLQRPTEKRYCTQRIPMAKTVAQSHLPSNKDQIYCKSDDLCLLTTTKHR